MSGDGQGYDDSMGGGLDEFDLPIVGERSSAEKPPLVTPPVEANDDEPSSAAVDDHQDAVDDHQDVDTAIIMPPAAEEQTAERREPIVLVEGGLEAGDRVAGVVLTEPLAVGSRLSCWRGTGHDDQAVTVHVLSPLAMDKERETFLAGARRMAEYVDENVIQGMVQIRAVDEEVCAYVSDISSAGTMADLPMLNWDFQDKLSFIRGLCSLVVTMHERDLIHGCWCPSSVLLDSDLKPIVCDVGVLRIADALADQAATEQLPYAAPEIVMGESPRPSADVFGLGRLLHFMLHGETPAEPDEILPKLDSICKAPAGLVRIIRKCTVRDPAQRYGTAKVLLHDLNRHRDVEAVGLRHPQGKEAVEKPQAQEPRPSRLASRDSRRAGERDGRRKTETARRRPSDAARSRQKHKADKPRAPGDDPLSTQQAGIVTVVGLAMMALISLWVYLTGSSSIVTTTLLILGAGATAQIVPIVGAQPELSRGAVAGACMLAAMLLNPVDDLARWGMKRQLRSSSSQELRAIILEQKGGPMISLSGMDLSGKDLSALFLRGNSFDGSNLAGTNFRGANLQDSTMMGTNVRGADFSGANMKGVQVALATGWQEARCNAATQMPEEWVCRDGKPQGSLGMDGESIQPPPAQFGVQ